MSMKSILLFASLFMVVLALSSSRNHPILSSENTWVQQDSIACDTSIVTFSGHVLPLLQANCTKCHNDKKAAARVNLSNYEGVKKVSDEGELMGTVTHSKGFKSMPKKADKLSDCQIALLQKWVNDGAKND